MEADVETPKYHASDITDKAKREKLLQDNPTALVKFNTFNRRKDKEENKELNQVQKSRLHRVRFNISAFPPISYIANDMVDSKFFKSFMSFVVYLSTIMLIFKTSLVVEAERSFEVAKPKSTPMDFNYLFFDTIQTPAFPKTNIYTSFPAKILDSIKLKDSTCVHAPWNDTTFEEVTKKLYKCGGDLAGYNKTCNFGSYTGPGSLAWISSLFSQVDLAGWYGETTLASSASNRRRTAGVASALESDDFIGACTPLIGNIQREIWALYYNEFIKFIELIVNIIFTVEFLLYQADVLLDWNPTRYWGNTFNQMEFLIVVTCWLSYAIDYYAQIEFFKVFFGDDREGTLNNICSPQNEAGIYPEFTAGGKTFIYDMSSLCEKAREEQTISDYSAMNEFSTILYTIYNRQGEHSKIRERFYGTSNGRYCDGMKKWNMHKGFWFHDYLCDTSDPYENNLFGFFGYYGLTSLIKSFRYIKIVVLDEQVRQILLGLRKAFVQMKVIIVLLVLLLIFFTFLFISFFEFKNEHLDIKWTYDDFAADAVRAQNLKPGEDDSFVVFSGFIDLPWTIATLFQILTLDQWSETFDKIQRGQLMHVYSENTSFCDFNSFRSLTGYRERYAYSDAPWGAKEIFGYLSAIFLPFLWLWLANVTFKNLVTGIIVNSFLQDSNEKRYESTEEIVAAEVQELEKEFAGDNHRVRIDMMEPIVSHVSVDSQKTDKTDTEPLLVNETISELEKKSLFMRVNYWKPFKWPYFEKHCRPLSSSNIWKNCSFKRLFRLMKLAFSKLWKKFKSCCKKKEKKEGDDDSIGAGGRITAHGGMTLDIEAPSTMSLRTNPMEMPELTVYDFDDEHESDENSEGSAKIPKSRTAVNSSTKIQHPALSNSNLAQMIKDRKEVMAKASKVSADSASSVDLFSRTSLFSKPKSSETFSHKSKGSHPQIHPEGFLNPQTLPNNRDSYTTNSSAGHTSRTASSRGGGDNLDEIDFANWEILIQIHEDKISGTPRDTLWPQDHLFSYLELMEKLQENLQERAEILRIFSTLVVDSHDTS